MLAIVEIAKYLPATVNNHKHSAAVELKNLITSVATAVGGKVSAFKFKDGLATVTIEGDQAIADVKEQLEKAGDNVEVRTLNPFQVQFEMNRKAEEKTRKMNATKNARKEPK